MLLRHEKMRIPGLPGKRRIFHISDVHFSASTSHENNQRVIGEILRLAQRCKGISAICVTGDLISRKFQENSFSDALFLMRSLQKIAPVYYSLGNHESDLPAQMRTAFFQKLTQCGITVLDNAIVQSDGVFFAGLTLPYEVYKNPNGTYFHLSTITREMVESRLGSHSEHPCILLAHTPLGIDAYAKWGADLVLSGHIHGGIVRAGGIGWLSPERRFLPKFTKGIFREGGCVMNVSAGIGKFRINNPPEVVCIDLLPEKGD